jgi:hypothetical protein
MAQVAECLPSKFKTEFKPQYYTETKRSSSSTGKNRNFFINLNRENLSEYDSIQINW